MEPKRPDPDHLLARVQRSEAPPRGRLRLYFGASAGVGKTFAMLLAAQRAREDGRDVVVGVIETHGRTETAALLEGLDRLPPKAIEHRGRQLQEFDLDGALARRPSLLLVDELAHSNVPGSRHPKRWQDVDELLAAGIDVWSTLNVQHLESLNDVVGGITGIRVLETLPDRVFDQAEEVVLVDLPADELLQRLRSGKVYLPQQAERAAANFFRKGNLIALREIALRRTADRIEDDVQNYRVEKSIAPVWKTEAAILAAVGPNDGSEHVVRSAARLAGQINARWHAVYVETPALQRLKAADRDRILGVLKLAESLEATTAVLPGANVAARLVDYARTENLSTIVIGRTTHRRAWLWWGQGHLGDQLGAIASDLDVLEVGHGGKAKVSTGRSTQKPSDDSPPDAASRNLFGYLWAVLACLATTAVAALLFRYFDPANIVMLFLLTVVLVAVRFGRGPAVLATFLGIAIFDYAFVPPRYTFAVSDVQYLLTFAIMLLVGLITGQLTAGLRFQARIAAHREQRSRSLFEFARELSAALEVEQVVAISTRTLQRWFGGDLAVFLTDAGDRLMPPAAPPPGIDLAIAQWAFDKGEQAGFATDTLAGNDFRYLPLKAPMRIRGVLAIRPHSRRWLLIPEQRRQLETLASLIALALERVHYVEIAQDVLIRMESERLRNSLLSALSHDLRTPLTVLVGLADALRITYPPLAGDQLDIATAILDESLRMSKLVDNLLDMARLQAGEVRLRKEWQSAEEVIGSAIRSAQRSLGERKVTVTLQPGLPLVEFDAVLIERVLVNLLENAAKYTPAGSPIAINAATRAAHLEIEVADNGPGLPPGMEEAVFEKFTRGEAESATPGVGLGLAICRAIIDAHHGGIRAANRAEGGAVFTLTLPLGTPPSVDTTDDQA